MHWNLLYHSSFRKLNTKPDTLPIEYAIAAGAVGGFSQARHPSSPPHAEWAAHLNNTSRRCAV